MSCIWNAAMYLRSARVRAREGWLRNTGDFYGSDTAAGHCHHGHMTVCMVKIMYQYRYYFINCHKCTRLMEILVLGKKEREREREYGNYLYFLHKFSVNLKVVLKNSPLIFFKRQSDLILLYLSHWKRLKKIHKILFYVSDSPSTSQLVLAICDQSVESSLEALPRRNQEKKKKDPILRP